MFSAAIGLTVPDFRRSKMVDTNNANKRLTGIETRNVGSRCRPNFFSSGPPDMRTALLISSLLAGLAKWHLAHTRMTNINAPSKSIVSGFSMKFGRGDTYTDFPRRASRAGSPILLVNVPHVVARSARGAR